MNLQVSKYKWLMEELRRNGPPLYSEGMILALVLSSLLRTAEPGDYLVTTQNRINTVLIVQEVEGDEITLQEISTRGKSPDLSWKQWVECGAPKRTSSVIYTINSKSGVATTPEQQKAHFLRTLLTMDFQQLAASERKKIGKAPRPGSADMRKTWNPTLVYEGRKYKDLPFEAYRTKWPRDGSPLACRDVTVYTPSVDGPYPNHFPYWVEIFPAPGDNKIRVIDSGRNLKVSKKR